MIALELDKRSEPERLNGELLPVRTEDAAQPNAIEDKLEAILKLLESMQATERHSSAWESHSAQMRTIVDLLQRRSIVDDRLRQFEEGIYRDQVLGTLLR